MKKTISIIMVLGVLVASLMSVSAAEVVTDETVAEGTFVSNMDADTYRATRTAQVEKALEDGIITQEQADLLLAHIEDVAAEGTFGVGPANGDKGDGNAECILGEDSNLGIFRSESAGQRTGSGNGVGAKAMDGSGSGNGYRGGNGAGRGTGAGNADGTGAANGGGLRGAGRGLMLNEDCVIEGE